MKIATMRRLDRWVGVPACLVLTLVRRLGQCFRRPPHGPVRRIVLVKPAEQGATVLAEAAIRRAIQLVGRENVWFLVFEENRFILDAMALIPPENVICLRTSGLIALVRSVLGAVLRLRRLRVDAAVDLEFFARASAVLTYLSGARCRVGFHAAAEEGGYRGDLLTHRLSYNPHLHTAQSFWCLVEAVTLPPGDLPALPLVPPPAQPATSRFCPTPHQVDHVRRLLRRELGHEDVQPLVLLNTNASDLLPLRRWPAERYVELARRLLAEFPEVRIAFTGSPSEAAAVEDLVRRVGSGRCVSMAGKTTLEELLTLYGLAEVLVTNDSGPAHFAMLTPIDVVTLFGPETPALFGALGPRAHCLWAGLACSPCVNAYNHRTTSCRNNVCMQRISVDDVFDRTARILHLRLHASAGRSAPLEPEPSASSALRLSQEINAHESDRV